MVSETIKRKAKAKINLGVDPLKVHEWLMHQGAEVEEADRITGCRTFPSEEKMRDALATREDYPWSSR